MSTPTTDPERVQLDRFLDEARAEAAATLDGLTDEQGRARLVPSLTTPLGLLKHLIFVEKVWFEVVLSGRTRAEVGIPDQVDPSFTVEPEDTVASVLAAYHEACERSRRIGAAYDLDHVAQHHRIGEVSLRWIYLHLLREINRHAGHGDILAEQLTAAAGSER